MYLNEIRVYGFKSFSDPVTLKLNRGITGIVGPNGSGKSNIVDAIRWVLGEQSAKELRATLMEDLIFNGTQKRAQANLADATLKFVNDGELPLDFAELELERKVYRSGESQYLINKETVRLKDINNILADTGLGTRTYSLFKRALIEDIVHNKPDALRNLFEESAGISLYRQSKRESLRKLIATQENLYRINDLAGEIEKQERELKRQAGRAKRYNEMIEIVKHLSQHVFKKREIEFQRLIDEIDTSIKTKDEKLKDFLEEIENIKESVTNKRADRKQFEDDYEKLISSKEKLTGDIHVIDSDMLVTNERIKSLETQIESRKDFREKHISEQPLKAERLKNSEEKLMETLIKIEETEKERGEGSNSEIETLYRTNTDFFNELYSKSRKNDNELLMQKSKVNEIAYKKESQAKKIEEKSEEHDLESSNLSRTEKDVQEKLAELEKVIALLKEGKESADALDAERNEKREAQRGMFEKRDTLSKEISNEEGKFEQIKSRIKESKESISEIKKYLSNENVEQIRNLVTADAGYEDYLKTAISMIINGIVLTKNEVEKLRNMDSSYLTILVSDASVKVNESVDALDKHVNAPDYLKAILSRFVIWESDDIPFDKNDGNYYVMKNGLLLTPEKLVLKSGEVKIINFKQAHDDSLNRIEVLKKSLIEAESMLEKSRQELSSLNFRFDKARNGVNECENRISFVKETLKAFEKNLEAKKSYTSKLRENILILKAEYSSTEKELSDIESNILKLEESQAVFHREVAEKEVDLNNIKERYIVYNNRKSEIENIYKSLNSEKVLLEKEIETLKNVLLSFDSDIKEIDDFIDDSMKQIENAKKIIDDKSIVKNALQNKLLTLDDDLSRIGKNMDEIDFEIKNLEENEEEKRSLSDAIKHDREENLIEREKHNTQKEINGKNIDTMIEIDEELISKYIETAEEELRYLSEKIANIGPINQLAFQEYTEVAERLEQMMKQKDDIVQAKENLEKTIKMIDAKAKTIFVQYFDTIKTTFKELFYEIFKSGNADINLVDENDPLESDIQITFEPGEKKIGKLVQLSDGERGMMIILLLFSMYMIKPTPVCIMDEIDAPLDDANVENFINLLKKFRHRTQFVLITHNKRTMEFCDFLFGVTMEDSGITSIFSLNLQTISQKFLDDATQSN